MKFRRWLCEYRNVIIVYAIFLLSLWYVEKLRQKPENHQANMVVMQFRER
ncbi:MAG: hypothetical protein M1324_03665 [Patescibacteria group bacterium]|nr:hypothetical protein [Patescibacteria group bacterium]